MNNRALISVGCDAYASLGNLSGAENDAQQIFNCLTEQIRGDYDSRISQLLLSPTLDEFRSVVDKVLFSSGKIDVLTVFFAGHGGPKNGSYYLCLRDTDINRMSTSAYPLSALFTALNECQPTQVNIIIDSCHAGGLVGDLSTLLKPENSGSNKSSCISLLAAACSNEYATEVNGNGVVTKLILSYLTGEVKLNSNNAYLDLTEIGKEITTKIEAEYAQTPTVYGLSLHGSPRFSKNPHFNSEVQPAVSNKLFERPLNPLLAKKIDKYTEDLWDEYRAIEIEPSAERLASTLRIILNEIEDDPDAIAAFINGISTNLQQQALKSSDSCGAITIVSTLLVLLQKYLANESVSALVASLLERRKLLIGDFAKNLYEGLASDSFCLVNKSNCLADLFYLPIRITKILGLLWSQVFINRSNTDEIFNDLVKKITLTILEQYKNSIVSISDEQAPYLYIISKASQITFNKDITRDLFHLHIQDLFNRKGNIANGAIIGDEVLTYLINRASAQERLSPELLANPSQLISVLINLVKEFINVDSFDEHLRILDHQNLVVFIPDTFASFSENIIYSGVNNAFKIGHGIWSFQDFERQFAEECLPLILKNKPTDRVLMDCSIIASLIFPNRIPWFLELA